MISLKKKREIIGCLNIPILGDEVTDFYCCKCDYKLAKGYLRVVIGERGPYIEFDDRHILKYNIYFPQDQKHKYFHEYLSKCPHQVFIYYQRETVAYADYKINCWYISPEIIKTDTICFDKLKQTVSKNVF